MKISESVLNQIIKDYNPDSIYIVGSSTQKIINYADIDVLVLYKNTEIYLKNRARRQYIDKNKHVEVFVNNYLDEVSDTINIFYAWTSLKLAEHVYGDNLLDLYDLDKYDLVKSNDYRRKVCSLILNEQKFVNRVIKRSLNNKDPRLNTNYLYKCYRMLLICYIITNKSYKLTDEQITILNKVHDEHNMSEELWAWCWEVLESEAHQQQWTL